MIKYLLNLWRYRKELIRTIKYGTRLLALPYPNIDTLVLNRAISNSMFHDGIFTETIKINMAQSFGLDLYDKGILKFDMSRNDMDNHYTFRMYMRVIKD